MVKITEKDEETYDKLGPSQRSGVTVGAKVISHDRFREKIGGWKIIKKTRVKQNGVEVFNTYYVSSGHIQDFLNVVRNNKEFDERIITVHQFQPETGALVDDPAEWPFGLMFITNEPVDEEFEDWEIVEGPREVKGLRNTYVTCYRSKQELWDELIETVRSDKQLNRIVERMVPNKKDPLNVFRAAKNTKQFKDIEHKRRRGISIVKGAFRKTKYDYPDGIVTTEQKRVYRRNMRKQRRTEE